MAAGPRLGFGKKGYPSHYGNKSDPPLSFAASKPLTHVPIQPGTTSPWTPNQPKGAHRAVYNDKDRTRNIDVMYHDPRKPPAPGGYFTQFSKADYHPRA